MNTKTADNIKFKRYRGLSLIELLVTLSIAAVLVGVAAPGVQSFIESARLIRATQQFSQAYALARQLAISRNQEVILCSGRSNCIDSNDWTQGLLISIDENGDRESSTSEIYRVFDPITSSLTLTANSGTTTLVLRPDGSVVKKSGSMSLVSFYLCSPKSRTDISLYARHFTINRTGRLKVRHGDSSTRCTT